MAETFCSCSHRASVEEARLGDADATRTFLRVTSNPPQMARATRSAAQVDEGKALDNAPAFRKGGTRKRKRTSNADSLEQPATKQQRTSESQEPPDVASEHLDTKTSTGTLGAGDVPIEYGDAEKILLVLESYVSDIIC